MRIMSRDIDFSEILLCEKLCKEKYQNILIYDISYKTFMSSKPLRIMFDEIDGFTKIHDGIRYLVLFGYGWFDKICDRIKYVMNSYKDKSNKEYF